LRHATWWRKRSGAASPQGHGIFVDANTNPVNDLVVRYLVISAFCRMARVGPAFDPIPLRPVVHYHMSGLAVDTAGRRMIESL
jgi:L-aspartate oxidase